MPQMMLCPKCYGDKIVSPSGVEDILRCPRCNGNGKVPLDWISVDEGRPDDEIFVFICSPREYSEPAWIGYLKHGDWFFAEGGPPVVGVTHWQPFPELPEIHRG